MSPQDQVNILLVDDQPAKLLTYETILAGLGENLIRANSGKEALEHLLKSDIAVVLVDVCMPDLDGFELTSMIRQHPRFQTTAIILVSAIHLTDIDRLKGYESGAVDYVSVPVVPEILRAKVRVFAELYRKTQQLERLNRELERRVAERTADLEASATRLQEADRRKDEFLATLSHELRNPLSPISSAARILRMKETSDPQLQWIRSVLDRQVTHLTQLIDDLLDVSRISRDRLELRKKPVRFSEVLEAAVEASQPHIERYRHHLTVALPEEPVYVSSDPVRLAQVFTNLLNNSAQYTEPGGQISITAERGDNSLAVRVKDNGVGITADQLPHIFEIFYRPDTSMERHGGLGIGLSLVSRLVELHGGTVEVLSGGYNQGSEFVVRLPLAERTHLAPAPEQAAGEEGRSHPLRVLIADDNQDSAQLLALLLELEGHQVRSAHDGREAIEAAADFRPNVVLLDIGMPKVNGYDVARTLRQRAGGRDLLIIAQTGWGQDVDRRRSMEAGFDAHFTKPVDYNALFKLMNSVGGTKKGAG